MIKSNAKQIAYINQLQATLNKSKSTRIIFDPYVEFIGNNDSCYLKPVIMIIKVLVKRERELKIVSQQSSR